MQGVSNKHCLLTFFIVWPNQDGHQNDFYMCGHNSVIFSKDFFQISSVSQTSLNLIVNWCTVFKIGTEMIIRIYHSCEVGTG